MNPLIIILNSNNYVTLCLIKQPFFLGAAIFNAIYYLG